MSQNTSTAVMQRRREPADSLDYFPTPPWATRALCERVVASGLIGGLSAWEPACGNGHMARPLAEYFGSVTASDVHPYGFGQVMDFLFPSPPPVEPDWIITNPPFRLAAEFVHRGLGIARQGVAMLVRTAFLEGVERHASLFSVHRPWAVMQFAERVPMVKGRLDKSSSSATSYCWIVWRTDVRVNDTAMFWIAPCRKRLERDEDYQVVA
ncbi:methyltransferase [Paramagnetospirillum marisnigri]|uniref:Methyltransferase n=1 Tax=Paramagnetospirillum marisnigri TaxID=1285242 RepID=A0A178MUD6_9PROT|nr:SAM-dependent methyltransferase [Paramagnetospirillum marisnigri]OAN53878.1 methyltransferase [Paramagnetospirillum marisnigri]